MAEGMEVEQGKKKEELVISYTTFQVAAKGSKI